MTIQLHVSKNLEKWVRSPPTHTDCRGRYASRRIGIGKQCSFLNILRGEFWYEKMIINVFKLRVQ